MSERNSMPGRFVDWVEVESPPKGAPRHIEEAMQSEPETPHEEEPSEESDPIE